MQAWSLEYGDRAQFLCICVDPAQRVALQFHQMFRFGNSVINGWIPSREYMPVGYGQLGCSGFIVADGKGCFVSRKTTAFLQYGDTAFAHLERILKPLMEPEEPKKSTQASFGGMNNLIFPGGGGCKVAAPSASSAAAPTTETTKDKQDYLDAVPSVGVQTMDNEHEHCLQTLKDLDGTPTVGNLQRVLEELENHFAHEEGLMKAHGFGGDGESKFSALASHAADHDRILDICRKELALHQSSERHCEETS